MTYAHALGVMNSARDRDLEQRKVDALWRIAMTEATTEETTATVLKSRDVAEALGTTARTLRIFLRASDRGCGAKARYAFTHDDIPGLKKEFQEWKQAQETKKAVAKERKEAREAQKQETTPNVRTKGGKTIHVLDGEEPRCGAPLKTTEVTRDEATCKNCLKADDED